MPSALSAASAMPYLADTHIVPLFLHIRARKGAAA